MHYYIGNIITWYAYWIHDPLDMLDIYDISYPYPSIESPMLVFYTFRRVHATKGENNKPERCVTKRKSIWKMTARNGKKFREGTYGGEIRKQD